MMMKDEEINMTQEILGELTITEEHHTKKIPITSKTIHTIITRLMIFQPSDELEYDKNRLILLDLLGFLTKKTLLPSMNQIHIPFYDILEDWDITPGRAREYYNEITSSITDLDVAKITYTKKQ